MNIKKSTKICLNPSNNILDCEKLLFFHLKRISIRQKVTDKLIAYVVVKSESHVKGMSEVKGK
jgi:hypothetical protein